MKAPIISYLKSLRDLIILEFEKIESGEKFVRSGWTYEKGEGGGEISLLRGKVFEKAAVNWSGVGGEKFPMDDSSGKFFATGISIITHMQNPKMPTVHMNIRYIETEKKSWFGGGYDLTPMGFANDEDTLHFHSCAETALAPFGADIYERFKSQAKDYFYIPHLKKERGVGGIFFDHFATGNFEQDLKMWKAVGESFLPAIIPIYQKRVNQNFSENDKQVQLKNRAHYVEFNLLYDRGTKFGFQSGGNHEAILCSMPPLASW